MGKRRQYARDAQGRFAPTPGGSTSSPARSSSSRRRSPAESLALSAGSISSKHLLRSTNPHARTAGAIVSVATHVARHPAVQRAIADALGGTKRRKR